MFFPYKDENPSKHFPLVVLALIVLNGIIFFAVNLSPHAREIIHQYGFIPSRFQPLSLISAAFLHTGILHLFFNMWFLWLFGDNVEDKFGKAPFLIFYLIASVLAFFAHSLSVGSAGSDLPCVGASGAVSAVLGAYLCFFPGAKIRFLAMPSSSIILYPKGKISAGYFIGTWFFLQLFQAMFLKSESVSIAFGAHIGGFIFGYGIGQISKNLFFNREDLLLPNEERAYHVEQKAAERSELRALQEEQHLKQTAELKNKIETLVKEKNLDQALIEYHTFETLPTRGALDFDVQVQIADKLYQLGKWAMTVQAYLRILFEYVDVSRNALAHGRIGVIYANKFQNYFKAWHHLECAFEYQDHLNDPDLAVQINEALETIKGLFDQVWLSSKHRLDASKRFMVLSQLIEEQRLNIKKIITALSSIGPTDGLDLGQKLRYNAEENLKIIDGVLLSRLTAPEAEQAAKTLQNIGIPALIVPDDHFYKFFKIEFIEEASVDEDCLRIKISTGKFRTIAFQKIIFIVIGQLFRKIQIEQNVSDFSLSLPDPMHCIALGRYEQPAYSVADLKSNMIVDIYSEDDKRYRISAHNFRSSSGLSLPESENAFLSFLENLSLKTGLGKTDTGLDSFISRYNWSGLYYKDADEFNKKSLWLAHLKMAYDLLAQSSRA